MAHIDYYFTTLSPYAYLGGDRLEQIAKRHGASVTYKPLDVLQLFGRTGGPALADVHPSRRDYAAQELRRIVKATGLPFVEKPDHWPTNPAPSSYAVIAAQKAGGGDLGKLVHGFMAAVWAQNLNVAEDQVVRDCLSAAGFDPALADSGLLDGADTFAANLEEAVSNGVFGVPFYITDDDERFWGQDRLDALDRHLAARG